jgi:pyruvate dehydrogenase E2 component (dihydrolipoamide acetyltransferase)
MPIEVTMPRLSDTMEAGTVVKWNVKEGDKVKSGDVIADIETDKATMELQSFDEGTVAKINVAEGQNVKVGSVILVLAGAGESVAAGKGSAVESKQASAPKAAASGSSSSSSRPPTSASSTAVLDRAEPAHAPTTNGASGDRVFASPLARKIAADSGLDLGRISGTGPSGRIIRKDVEAAIAGGGAVAAPARAGSPQSAARPQPAPLPPAGATLEARSIPLSNMRRIIATRLVQSKTTIPHYQVTVEVDMDKLLDLREQLNEQLAPQGVKLSVNDFLIRACALAMHQHPQVNGRWAEKGDQASIEVMGDVNIGIAISLPEERGGGLVVGTIRSADHAGLRQISAEAKRLADKARAKGLTPEEMSDSTFTISNLGMFGVDHFTAIINPPNVAILAVGAAIDRPVVRGGQIVVGRTMSMTMSSDHRIVDGAMAARYLQTVKQLLEAPATLLV